MVNKFFLNLENSKSVITSIRRVFDAQGGKLTFNSQSILKELENFYKSFYAKTNSNTSEETFPFFLDNVDGIPVLAEHFIASLRRQSFQRWMSERVKRFP